MTQSFYRYRSVENLLGDNKELCRQQIFFASSEQLNDPMEGYQDVIWNGDVVVWINLIKHYILCLTQTISFVHIMGNDFDPSLVNRVLHWSASTLPTDALKEMHERIVTRFFGEDDVAECVELLAKHRKKVRVDELTYYMSTFHMFAFDHIMTVLKERGLGSVSV